MKRTRRNRGFTLVEIMLVVVIIGILAGVVLPNIVKQRGVAERNSTKAQIRNIETAIDLYYTNIGRFPDSLKDLTTDPGDPNWMGPYLRTNKALKDAWGNEFVYDPDGNRGLDYDLYSIGPNEIDGDEDDIANWGEDEE